MFKILIFLVFAFPALLLLFILKNNNLPTTESTPADIFSKPSPTPTPESTLKKPPSSKTLPGTYHVFQTFNNCGPAALSMTLSYYGINVTQKTLGDQLRPYQNTQGDNDDKSVTLQELGEKSKDYELTYYHRPLGNIETIKYFIDNDIPVITRTLLKEDDDIGHYRVIKGFDETSQSLIQDDSLQGKNLSYKYSEFDTLWKQFNYEYLVLIPKEKQEIAKEILGDDLDSKVAWQKAVSNSLNQLESRPNDILARFNLSVAYYNVGDYQKSVEEFEKIESKLTLRTLWYQIEPILSYEMLGNYSKVFEITNKILSNHNRAFSELYLIRGKIYLKQQNEVLAKEEFKKAVIYNESFKAKIPIRI